MKQLGLLSPVPDTAQPHAMAPASLEGWTRILQTIDQRCIAVFLALCDAVDAAGHDNFTGAEIAEQSGISIFNVRPRCTDLLKLKVIERLPMRASRVATEAPSHPYRPTVPRTAVLRWRESLK